MSKKAPRLGTPEGRERPRASRVPLDEWVDIDSPAWRAEQAARDRAERRVNRSLIGLLVAGMIALVAWPMLFGETPSERLPTCSEASGLPCAFTDGRGARAVEVGTRDDGVRVMSADAFDQAVYDAETYGFDGGVPDRP